MGAGKTCIEGKHVEIDISNTGYNGNYQDDCKNTIKLEKRDQIPGLNGYKKYTHSFPSSCSIRGIKHHRVRQKGFSLTDGSDYNKKVTVYYLRYDEGNLVPLIVGLEKSTGSDNYYYHERTSPLSTSNQWIDKDNLEVNQESDLSPKLATISTQLKQFVVLNLGQTNGNYYANGNPSQAPAINGTLKIEVTESEKIHDCYKKFTHSLETKDSFRVLSTKISRNNIPFNPPVYGTLCSEVFVYYWTGDTYYSQPLLIQLGEEGKYYTTNSDGNNWTKSEEPNDGDLKKKLDKLNCEKNKAHQIDISETSGSRSTTYNCPSCSLKLITVINYDTNDVSTDYSYYLHYASNSFSRFKDGQTEQSGIAFTAITSTVFVYHYPKGDYGIPLLIYLLGSASGWYQRESLGSTAWKPVIGDKPGHPSEHTSSDPKIVKLLKDILPTVTIDVGKTNTQTGYEDPGPPGGQKKEQIKVERQDLEEGYTSFAHTVQGKYDFILGEVKHCDDTTLSEISSFIIKSVTAYYYAKGGFTYENLLLVGFEKRSSSSDNYEYYIRGDEDKDGTSWKLDRQQASKLDVPKLTQELAKIKERLEKKKSKGKEAGGLSGPGDGIRPSSVTDSTQRFFQQILDTIRSKPAEIGGGVGGTIGTGLVGFGTWKLWSKIMSCLITKAI
ncbi:hypothetical protein BEWA_026530 [Theileria equi strain WA]|uniref:Uncharacterized protein n=1 Tax=Theileria equi strain WA TaxID=1537102 RepID=L0AY13_THEEQ|nr:hypothetical protein BEWA_026530 [Theileria equi strain WA]AFZ79804.1 hypothetical protein BEWA_026530 [Theileria equi strain WA]|eukprot:XP_004829470.1 hypothetical protein BEWA_026530 [Theileria equi strain WA]